MKIAIGNDHAAVEMKKEISEYLKTKGHEVINFGTDNNESCDYPLFAKKVGLAVRNKEVDLGVLICGTGVGIGIAANKVKGIRCAMVSESYSAKMARIHNDANIIAFGARVIGVETAKEIVDAFINNSFEGGRHQRRVDLINEIENRE